MTSNLTGTWRTLDELEIALMKRMKLEKLPRDYIMSFFMRPGRVISPAAINEVFKTRPEISPADLGELEAFVARRINEANEENPYHGFGPVSAVRVRDILRTVNKSQNVIPGLESYIAELKSASVLNKAVKAKIAKTLSAFANNEGGYVFIGIEDDGEITGLPVELDIERFWNELSDVITRNFTPFFRWERSVVAIGETKIAVAYAYQAMEQPIMASADYADIVSGRIYFRYNRSVEAIRPGDMQRLLSLRDKRVASAAVAAASANAPAA